MKKKPESPQKEKRRRSLINLVGTLLLVAAGVLIALLFFRNSPRLLDWYGQYNEYLVRFENYVLNLPPNPRLTSVVIPLMVLLLYAIKGVLPFPLFPISLMCVITGAVLPMTMSFAVNIAGVAVLTTIKYWWGRRLGGGQAQRLLKLHPTVRAFLERDSKSKPWLLFLFRLTPTFPINAVSQIYGAMCFDYADYTLISLLGFLPRLISYPFIGHNVFDPLTIPFLVPLIIIFTLSGVSLIGVNLALAKHRKEE